MKVLVLGARGMLGRDLVRAFASDDVVAWDREELDITDAASVSRELPSVEPDIVLNAAAYTDVDGAEEERAWAERVNGRAVGFLAETCATHDVPLLHVSTDYVFAGDAEEGCGEDDVPDRPVNAYGASKLLGERLLREKARKFWLVRTAWLFGPHGKNFVRAMLARGRTTRVLPVVHDQHGSPTYTRDLAAAIRALVADRAPFGVYHLTNSGATTWAEFARAIFAAAGMRVTVAPIPSSEYPAKAKRPAWSVLKNTKRPPLRSWRDAVRECVRIARTERA